MPNPIEGMSEAEYVEWFSAAPTRAEMYAVLSKLTLISAQLLNTSVALKDGDKDRLVGSLREALDGLAFVYDRLPGNPDDVDE